MTSRRTEIRNALKARLTGLATTAGRVFDDTRVAPLASADLPALFVVTGGEDPRDATLMRSGLPIVNPLVMRVDILVKATGDFVATANEILDEVKAALFDSGAHNTLGGLAHFVQLASIADPEVDDSMEKPAYRLPVILRIDYS